MTNSRPKNNKIARQSPPHGKKWTPQRKSVTYFPSSASKDLTTNPGAQMTTATKKYSPASSRQSCSPNNNRSVHSMQRSSPLRLDSPRGSPTNNFYAGPKFSEPPSPATLPKPPVHWTGLIAATSCSQESAQMMEQNNISQHLNEMINLQA